VSITPGRPDLTPEEVGRRVESCHAQGHDLRLNRAGGGALHVNQMWTGKALAVGCPLCDYTLIVPVSAEDIESLSKDSRC
jgi:hypothetical protein